MIYEIFPLIAWGGLAVGIMFFCLWLLHFPLKNAGIVDIGWGPGFIILAGLYVSLGAGWTLRNTIFFLMFAVWGLRIALFLIKRLLKEGHEDRRYQTLRAQWAPGVTWKFLAFFETQAMLQIFLSLPAAVATLNPRPELNSVEMLGLSVWMAGLIGETIADEQLLAFKSNPSNAGRTCDQGLWRYSRHPNYFCEWLIWVGFSIYSIPTPLGWISPISPLVMYILMMYFSGIPLAEAQALKTRGEDYRRYQQTTNAFFPWFKRKCSPEAL